MSLFLEEVFETRAGVFFGFGRELEIPQGGFLFLGRFRAASKQRVQPGLCRIRRVITVFVEGAELEI